MQRMYYFTKIQEYCFKYVFQFLFFIFEFLKSSLHCSNSTLCRVCYDNYLFGVVLEGAAMQSGWGVHERVMENDINVLLKLLPPEQSVTFATVSSHMSTMRRVIWRRSHQCCASQLRNDLFPVVEVYSLWSPTLGKTTLVIQVVV